MFPRLRLHVDLVDGRADGSLEGSRDSIGLAGKGQDASVMTRIARSIEEEDGGCSGDGRGESIDDFGPAALAEIRDGFDESGHAGIVTRRSRPCGTTKDSADQPECDIRPASSEPNEVPVAVPRRNLLARNRDYLKLWSAATVSLFGTQVSLVAIPVIAIFLLDAPAFQVALLGTVEFLPFLLFTLPAGAWVDRLPRRLILVAGDFGRAAALLSIPIAYELGVLTIWQLYVVGFVNGFLTVFFDVADQSFLPAILEADELVEGNSKLQVSGSAAQVLGQPLGGGAVGLLGAPVAVFLDAVSFVVSGGLIFWIRKSEPKHERAPVLDPNGAAAGIRAEIAEGLRYVLGHPYLRYIAASTGLSNLFSNIAFATFAVFAYRTLGLTPFLVGLIGGLGSTGVLVGALVAGRISARIGVGRTILWSAVLSGPATLLAAVAQPATAVPILTAAFFLGSFTSVVYNISQVSLRQAITPQRIQGRMNATMRFLVWGTIPIGQIVGGVLATAVGVREAVIVGGALGCVAFVPILFSPVRSLWRIPTPETAPDAEPSSTGPVDGETLIHADAAIASPGSALD
jgi:MFS family permease